MIYSEQFFLFVLIFFDIVICPPTVPYCNEALNGKEGFAVKDIHKPSDPDVRHFDFVYTEKVRHRDCIIGSDGGNQRHGLRINFESITRTTEVLISADMATGTKQNAIRVSLRSGSETVHCYQTPATVTVYLAKFTVFSCKNAKHPRGVQASAIEIKSDQFDTSVSLVQLQAAGSLGWVILAQTIDPTSGDHSKKCLPPEVYADQMLKPHKEQYGPGENVTIVCTSETGQPLARETQRTCLITGKWSGEHEKCHQHQQPGPSTKHCGRVEPYHGMPQRYNNYSLVLDGSINELLLREPCRKGYKHVGQLSDVKQCKDGVWEKKSFPKCEEISIKVPPHVEHADWTPVPDQDGFMGHVIYTCEYGYYVSPSAAKATYILDTNEWVNVPQCQGYLQHFVTSYPAATIVIIGSAVIIVFCVPVLLFIYLRKKRSAPASNPPAPASNPPAPNEQNDPENRPLVASAERVQRNDTIGT